MNALNKQFSLVVGLNVPAEVGMNFDHVSAPALIVDLDAFERNVQTMRSFTEKTGLRHWTH